MGFHCDVDPVFKAAVQAIFDRTYPDSFDDEFSADRYKVRCADLFTQGQLKAGIRSICCPARGSISLVRISNIVGRDFPCGPLLFIENPTSLLPGLREING